MNKWRELFRGWKKNKAKRFPYVGREQKRIEWVEIENLIKDTYNLETALAVKECECGCGEVWETLYPVCIVGVIMESVVKQ